MLAVILSGIMLFKFGKTSIKHHVFERVPCSKLKIQPKCISLYRNKFQTYEQL